MAKRLEHYAALNGLRTILAAMIFFYHWFFHYANNLPLILRAPFQVGYVAVPGFFSLSAFLLTLQYAPQLRQGQFRWSRYLWLRFIRIYPLYLVVLTGFVVAFGRPENMMPHSLKGFLAAYTLTQALFPSQFFIGTTVGWTLTLQIGFYILAPWLIRWCDRPRHPAGRFALAFGIGLAALGIGALLARYTPPTWLLDTWAGQPQNWLWHYSLLGHLIDFMPGIAIGLALITPQHRTKIERYAGLWIWLGAAGTLSSILLQAALPSELGDPLNRLLGASVAFWLAMMLGGIIAWPHPRHHPIPWLLSRPPLVYLGHLSYALFIIQLTEPCQRLYWLLLGQIENRILRAILLYFLATLIAAALYHLIEKPITQFLRTLFRRNYGT